MAEISAVASIIGVAGAGARLSLLLYEFASTVAPARGEIISVGHDISLSSAVLKQVASVLDNQKAARFSTTALGTTLEIVERCLVIFQEIDSDVRGLMKERADDKISSVTLNFIAKVKWTFKRSEVRLLQGTLDSMKTTLQLMLTMLDISERIYSGGNLPVNILPASDGSREKEEEQVQAVAQSLVIAQQVSIERLRELEKEGDEENPISGDAETHESPPPNSDYIKLRASVALSIERQGMARRAFPERVSEWLSGVASNHIVSHPGSSASTVSDPRQKLLVLAEKWITGGESRIPTKNVENRSNQMRRIRKVITKDKDNVQAGTRCTPEAAAGHKEYVLAGTLSTPEVAAGHKEKRRENDQDNSSNKKQSQSASSTSSLESWEKMSSRWEGIITSWIKRLEDNPNGMQDQLSRQISHLSAAGIELFHAIIEMQGLHASTEKEFQQLLAERRAEQERSQEFQRGLKLKLAKLEYQKNEAVNEMLMAKQMYESEIWDLKTNIRSLDEMILEERKASYAVKTEKLDLERLVSELREELEKLKAEQLQEERLRSETIAKAVAEESERLISKKKSRLTSEFTRLMERIDEF